MPYLEFKGKYSVYSHHLAVPPHPLVPDPERSVGPMNPDDNLIVHGDNLVALKALLPRYAERVKCVYIDPPYNTGNEKWAYNDNVNSPQIQTWLKVVVDREDLERHDKWLCMMWPRLHAIRDLLADDGVIFVSIDDNEIAHLRMLMDEIFGEENFVANIVWNHRKSSQNDIDFSLSHNYIVCYARMRSSFLFNPTAVEEGKFSNPDNDPRGPWVADPMDAPHVRENLTYEIVNPRTGATHWPPAGRHWRFSKDRFEAALSDNRIIFGSSGHARPQYKRFLSEARDKGTNIFTIWSDVGTATDGTKELQSLFQPGQTFQTPKPTDLIKRIVQISVGPDDLVLDSFAGSGTTAHAVLALNKEDGGNRRFILVECEDYADATTAERVRRVMRGVPNARDADLREGLGGSFTYMELGEAIGLEEMVHGEALPSYEALAEYLLHAASGSAAPGPMSPLDDLGLFHQTEKVNYYLLWKPDVGWLRSAEAVLNGQRADRVGARCRAEGRKAVVFAAAKYISQRDLSDLGIIFCQIPYELPVQG